MNIDFLLNNISNPAFLFFILGILAVKIKSDLYIPENSSKFISIYLLLSIGFKGGQELSHENFSPEIIWSAIAGIAIAVLIPIYTFFILKRKFDTQDAGAIAASYGSVSAVTFVTACAYLETQGLKPSGHMVAIMALMESPAIIVGLLLINFFNNQSHEKKPMREVLIHSLTNGSIILIFGSLIIGYFANERDALGIKPFTNDIFKGFLAVFLLDMGITCGKRLNSTLKNGWFPLAFGILIPLINGCIISLLSALITTNTSNRFIFAILAASASYIAVPAAMKIANTKANPGLYLSMALAITFPLNITLGMPIYYYLSHFNW